MKVNEMKKTDYEITLELTLSYSELNDRFVYCEDCGKLLFRNDAICVDDEYFCNDCVTECDLCGRFIRCEEAWPTSDSDYSEKRRTAASQSFCIFLRNLKTSCKSSLAEQDTRSTIGLVPEKSIITENPAGSRNPSRTPMLADTLP